MSKSEWAMIEILISNVSEDKTKLMNENCDYLENDNFKLISKLFSNHYLINRSFTICKKISIHNFQVMYRAFKSNKTYVHWSKLFQNQGLF
jgi:hypothetical protein